MAPRFARAPAGGLMEIISILRVLRRRWLLVLLGVPLALFVGISAVYHASLKAPHLTSRQVTGGVAVGRTLLTMNTSPSFALSDTEAPMTLPQRADMLSNVLSDDALRTEVARRAGVGVS